MKLLYIFGTATTVCSLMVVNDALFIARVMETRDWNETTPIIRRTGPLRGKRPIERQNTLVLAQRSGTAPAEIVTFHLAVCVVPCKKKKEGGQATI